MVVGRRKHGKMRCRLNNGQPGAVKGTQALGEAAAPKCRAPAENTRRIRAKHELNTSACRARLAITSRVTGLQVAWGWLSRGCLLSLPLRVWTTTLHGAQLLCGRAAFGSSLRKVLSNARLPMLELDREPFKEQLVR